MSRPLLLLIDDAPEMGLIVSGLSRRAGWDAAVSIDAEEAWRALAERRPDLVLLDVNLPGASGLDWLRRVRAAPAFAAGLVVALYTHWGLPADVAAGLDAGVDFVFDKDLASRPDDWRRRLAEIGEAGRGGHDAAWPNAEGAATMKPCGRPAPPPREWAAAFRLALRHLSLRRLTGEVLSAVWRRVLTRALGPRMPPPQTLDAWIGPDGLEPAGLPPTFAPASPLDLAAGFAEQTRRLLGDEAAAAFRAGLASVPGVREFLVAP